MAVPMHQVFSMLRRFKLGRDETVNRLRQEEGWIDYKLSDPDFVNGEMKLNSDQRLQIEFTKLGTLPEPVRKGLQRVYLDAGWSKVEIENISSGTAFTQDGAEQAKMWKITFIH